MCFVTSFCFYTIAIKHKCSDFKTQTGAQLSYKVFGNNSLDGDKDGIACERLSN